MGGKFVQNKVQAESIEMFNPQDHRMSEVMRIGKEEKAVTYCDINKEEEKRLIM